MTIEESLELIKKYNACNNEKPIECLSKECEECEHSYDEKEWYQMFNQIAQWLEKLKELRETTFNYTKMLDARYEQGRADAIEECIDALDYCVTVSECQSALRELKERIDV